MEDLLRLADDGSPHADVDLDPTDPYHVVGYLTGPHPATGHGHGLHCRPCHAATGYNGPAVYVVNLSPYRGVCCRCGVVLFRGCGTELFDGDPDRTFGRLADRARHH